ncbi:MAG TPA: hypothetical protein VHL58_13385 [Thermoanaerobaculia bacterium]|nr:hypothetical protein [Thermoanaerobaculia bacterium]
MVRDESVTVKGSPIKSLLKFIDTELTASQREEAFRNLPPKYAERLRVPPLATESIPVAMLNALTEECAKVKGEPLETFARRAGSFAASEAFSGIYRVFALILTPHALLGKASIIWGSLYNRGEMKIEGETKESARVIIHNFPMEPAGCARITGWLEKMVALTGAKNGRVTQTKCFSRGAAACEWEIVWGKVG